MINRDMTVRSLKKCGISLSLDGSESGEFELDSESKIEDDEDNFEVTDSCSSTKNESCD